MIKNNIVSISLKIKFVLANSDGPDEMHCRIKYRYPLFEFYLGLHCLSKYRLGVLWTPKGLQFYRIFPNWLIR